ncbi:hypothetical protein ABT364_19710 [Massilia sp. SR12]
MEISEQQKRQAFFDDIVNYQFIREDGRLVLEPFCVYLSHCFGFDSILEISPKPREIYMLLIELIRERIGEEEASTKIQTQDIKDWRPELAYIFPERQMTCIHVGALVMVSHDWIYGIGHTLMGIPEPGTPGKYFAWAKEEWLAVHTFINGYHNAFMSFQKQFDRDSIQKNGFSMFEALHLAYKKDIDFDSAASALKARHDSYLSALGQVSKALNDAYYLEAIALEECLISNCLFNFLDAKGKKLSGPTFYTLLKELGADSSSAYGFPSELLRDLDAWRKERNNAIHGFISAHSQELNNSRANFSGSTQTTAVRGLDLCNAVVSWYEVECVNFIRHEFPSESHRTVH